MAGADLGSDVVVDAQVDFVGGLAFDIDTKVWLNSSLSVPVASRPISTSPIQTVRAPAPLRAPL